jgi:hypothetical protein
MRPEYGRQSKIEPAPNSDTKAEVKIAFFVFAGLCVALAITGIREGDLGGLVPLGTAVLAGLHGLRA